MKTKVLYLTLIVALLLSACSTGSVASNQGVDEPVLDVAENSSTTVEEQQPLHEQNLAQDSGGGIPPDEAIEACTNLSEGDICEFTWEKGAETGVCEMVQGQLACSPQREQSDTPSDKSELIPSTEPQLIVGEYTFSEGPIADTSGNIYFSDINAGRIYKWSPDGTVDVFLDGLNNPNGLAFNSNGMLIACEGGSGRIISISLQGEITVLVDQYDGIRFNEPNDLWIDPQGGIYFTDPAYQSAVVQDGEHVYYLSPDGSQVMRVIDDLVRPNGIVGTSDGRLLYVTDHGAGQTFIYDINTDGTLSNKQLFVSVGSDGMTLDADDNLFLTTPDQVQVFDVAGDHIQDIPVDENPTNVTFGGEDGRTLFITARTKVYNLQKWMEDPLLNNDTSDSSEAEISPDADGFTLGSSAIVDNGTLPIEYTCDGDSATLPLTWDGAPAETVSFAVVMNHTPGPGDVHWYWVLYNIPADVTSLSKNSSGIGTLGTNGVNGDLVYAPPCSKGPGEKVYTYTVYALSALPEFSVPASQVSRDVLLESIQNITLASAELNVTYARQ
jgi:gluconolactonase